MEEGSRKREVECVKMTVIKFNDTNENFSNNNKLIHTNQLTSLDETESVSPDEDAKENSLSSVDDHELSTESASLNNEFEGNRLNSDLLNSLEDKENQNSPTDKRIEERNIGSQDSDALASTSGSPDDCESKGGPAHHVDDEEVFRRAKEEGAVSITFPGRITQDGCCRFVCELLKCVLYQRQQMPMTYDQMVFLQKQQHNATQNRQAVKSSLDLNWRRCQRMLQDLDEVLAHLEALFSLSHVPRVLFLLGGSTTLPTEQYEVNLEAVAIGAGEKSLRTSPCLRQLFRMLFVADLLSDAKSVRLMSTTVMALAHRDCGVSGFKPKLNFKVPTKGRSHVISIASDASHTMEHQERDLKDYIWFQAPVTVRGFCK